MALSSLLTITVVRYRWVLKQTVRVVAGSHATGIEAYMPAPNARAQRAVHPYSVIPGGVASIDEVQASVQHDPVVAAHYRGISPYALYFERLPVPVYMYASYRIGQSVYWTNHRILVPRGELALRDESHFIRARCGNLLAFDLPPGIPELPQPPLEPPDLVFDYGTPAMLGTIEPAPAEPARLAKAALSQKASLSRKTSLPFPPLEARRSSGRRSARLRCGAAGPEPRTFPRFPGAACPVSLPVREGQAHTGIHRQAQTGTHPQSCPNRRAMC